MASNIWIECKSKTCCISKFRLCEYEWMVQTLQGERKYDFFLCQPQLNLESSRPQPSDDQLIFGFYITISQHFYGRSIGQVRHLIRLVWPKCYKLKVELSGLLLYNIAKFIVKPVEYHHFIQKKRLCAQYINGERQCLRTKVLRVEQKTLGINLILPFLYYCVMYWYLFKPQRKNSKLC